MNSTRLVSRRALVVLTALAFGACSDSLLDVDNPDGIDPGAVNNPTGATALYAGALAELANAHDGGGGAQGLFGGVIMTSGLFSDEFRFGGTPPEVRQLDLTDVTKENSFFRTTYLQLHVAREAAERAAAVLTEVGEGAPDRRIGEMYAVSGFIVNVLGELFCAGIPFSTTLNGSLEYGQPLGKTETFALALQKYQAAQAAANNDARILNFIAVGRGRALLNSGQFEQAAAAVAAVPSSFVYTTNHDASPDRLQNFMKAFIFDFDYMSVSDREGTNGLNFATAGDPRVVTNFAGPSRFDGETPHYQYLLYNDFNDPVIIASGVEARLIQAEAALRTGDVTGWLTHLAAARAEFDMPPAADPGSEAARVDLMFRERAFSLFATGHRVGDLRRLVTQYNRAANTVYPIGPYHKDNLTRGADRSFVIPTSEENNPNYSATGCAKTAP